MTLHEDEVIRITITNDRPGSRVISLGSERDLVMRAGETKSVTLTIRQLQGFRVSVMGEPMITRAATVRLNYGAHANVICEKPRPRGFPRSSQGMRQGRCPRPERASRPWRGVRPRPGAGR